MVAYSLLQQTHHFFKARRYPANKQAILHHLKCSESSFKRALKALKDEYGAPIVYHRDLNGYQYSDEKFELDSPSFWLSPNTLLALVATQKMLHQVQLDFLNQPLSHIQQHIQQFLKKQQINLGQIERIRLLPINARIHNQTQFQQITAALLQRETLALTYHARATNQISQRIVSPQRLAHYKDNWYLDAWCHNKQAMRMFALDAIQSVQLHPTPCIDVAEAALDALLTSGYGIFAGNQTHSATLIFSAYRARWVAAETWHPQQKATWLSDGRYQLELPYTNTTELLMDIQRHLPEVEIQAPPDLKQALVQHLQQALAKHQAN